MAPPITIFQRIPFIVGLENLDGKINVTLSGNRYTVDITNLPSQITTTDDYDNPTKYKVEWNFTPPEVPGYLKSEDAENNTWYYIHETEFEVTLNLLDGDKDYHLQDNWNKIEDEVLSSFALYTQDGQGDYTATQLSELEGLDVSLNDNGTVTLTINGLPMYETSGTRVDYAIDLYKTDESGSPIPTPPEGAPDEEDNIKLNVSEDPNDTNDSFSVSYNNDHAGGTITAPDQVYSGGIINLQLTGTTHYSATKQWWDTYNGEGDMPDMPKDARPDGEFQLWRYIKGQGVETAEPVRNNGAIVKLEIDGKDEQKLVFTLGGEQTTEENILPKYNGEGYEYIYVVREYLNDSSGYRQIFGKVEQETDGSLKITDTLPDGVTREGNNDFVYNDGTLTNTISEYVTVTANKTWDAAVYQSMLEDVEVTLTLQSRPKVVDNEDEYDWVNTTTTRELTGFDAESLDARSVSVSMPKYDAQGRELEYRWVESSVNSETVNPETGEFTINLSGDYVTFISEAEYSEDSDGNTFTTNIKNKIRDTIEYDFTKKWADGTTPKKVYFAIYQYVDEMKNEPYIIFSMDETNVEIIKPEGQDGDHDGISIKEGSVASKEPSGNLKAEWHVTLENLPEFDEDGRRYEYLILEGNSKDGPWHVNPSLQSSRDETGYTSVITNGGAGGKAIVVQKVWADDSDVDHRSPVTIQVYDQNGNEIEGAEVTLGETGENGEQIWTDIVSIGDNNPEDVYVLETKVGETPITYNQPQNPTSEGFVSPEYETKYHRYRVLYDKQTIGSENSTGGTTLFTVTNQRLGNVDVTVEKTWNVGDGEKLKAVIEALKALENPPRLVLQLEFDPNYDGGTGAGYEIGNNADGNGYVQLVDGQQVSIESPGSAENENDETTWKSVSYQQTLLSADMFGEGKINTEEEKWVTNLPQTIYFWNLPKYNADGEVVRYTIKELWVDSTGNPVVSLPEALATAYAEFTSTITETEYIAIGEEDEEDGEESSINRDEYNDKHDFSCVNSLSGTKTVEWHKLWKDQYASDASLRPDLYLDIYQVGYHSANVDKPTVERITQNYRWYDVTKAPSGDKGTGDGSSADDDDSPEVEGEEIDPNHWRAEIQGVAKYDAKGYEYYYYAVEHTSVDYDAIDYYDGQYYAPRDTSIGEDGSYTWDEDNLKHVGGKDGPDDTDGDASGEDETSPANPGDWVYPVANETQDGETNAVYGLRESGTFQNGLEGDAVLSAAKQWNSLPEGWPSGQLPTVEFTLYRYPQTNPPADGPEAPEDQKYGDAYATLTIESEDWGAPDSGITVTEGNRYSFNVAYYQEKENRTEGSAEPKNEVVLAPDQEDIESGAVQLLDKYDDNGNLYVYTLRETKISFAEGADANNPEDVYPENSQSSNGSLITNVYKPDTGSIAIRKYLYLPEECFEANGEFPAVKFQLMRLKFGADGEMNKEDEGSWEKYGDPITWTSDQVKAAAGRLNEGESEKLVSEEFIFKDVPIYAPNGKEYTYKVVEVKDDFLEGYDTWAVAGGKREGELESIMDAEGNANKTSEVIIDEVTRNPETEEPTTPGNEGNGQDDTGNQGNTGGSTQTDPAPDPEESTIKATFINKPIDDTVQLKGEKIWDDFNNAFDLRPEKKDDLKLTVTRSAEAQDGQDNAISETELPEGSYSVTWEEETWTYTITGTEGSGELERYAPNGMPWKYTVTESRADGDNVFLQYYTASPNNGEVSSGTMVEGSNSPTITMPNLTNSMATTLRYQKVWQDQKGEPITEDYLGYPVTVEFQVQVRTVGSAGWSVADADFFNKYLDTQTARAMGFDADAINWTPTITANLGDDDWGASYTIKYTVEGSQDAKLPTVVKDEEGNFIELEYRVVETKVTFGTGGQVVTITPDTSNNTYSVDANNNFLDTPTLTVNESTSTTTNRLKTTKLAVKKVWANDGDYADITRPTTNNPVADWEVWFVIQRQVAGEQAWENVTVFRLCGSGNEATGEAFIGLPQCDASGKPYTYQIRELPPNTEGTYTLNTEGNIVDEDGKTVSVIEAGNIFSSGVGWEYTATYEGANGDGIYTATNTLVTESNPEDPVTTVTVQKNWQPAGQETNAPNVTVQLQYSKDGGTTWADFQDPETLESTNGWKHTWTNLPDLSEQNVEYQVVETNLDDKYVQLLPIKVEFKPGGDDGSTTFTYTITNVPKTSVHVKKVWLEDTGISHEPITVGLYRTTAGGGEAQPVSDTSGNGNYKLQLTSNNRWSVTFTDLPKCDANGTEYIYSVKEIVDGSALEDGSVFKLNENDYRVDYSADEDGTQIITNTQLTSLSGTKTWKDNNDAYDTRPDEETFKANLKLSWSTDNGSNWTVITNLDEQGIRLTIEENGNTWTYTFDNLPKYGVDTDGKSVQYTYKVEESALPGYSGAVDDGDNNEAATNTDGTLVGPDFTNTLTDEVSINGTKTWDVATVGDTPTLKLERKADGEEIWETVAAEPTWITVGTVWTYRYEGLAMYDNQQRRYTYRVKETKQDGYDVYYEDADGVLNGDITNVQRGSLRVSKEVTGRRGNHSYAFGFSVTFTLPTDFDTGLNGTPTINWTKSDGESGIGIFENGTAIVSFRLSDDETIMFTNLPGNTTYTVTETDSNRHDSSATGDVGMIPPGDMAQAEFNNYRGGGGGDTPDPDEPDPEIPDEPTPGEDIPPDEPDTPDEPDNPDDPGTDIPDEPTPGEDVPPDEPGTDIPDEPTPGGDVPPDDPNTPDQPGKPGLPQTGQLWWPVLLLAAVGAVMSLVGLWNIKRYRGKHGKNKV